MTIEESNIFSFAGIVETPEAYYGAIALYDYFWILKPELREKLIRSWISTLEKTLEEDYLEKVAPTYAEGIAIVMVAEEPIEERSVPDNVIPFGRRNVKRIEPKKNEG